MRASSRVLLVVDWPDESVWDRYGFHDTHSPRLFVHFLRTRDAAAAPADEAIRLRALRRKMFLDLIDRVLGQVLVDFGDDPTLHIGVEGNSQVRKRPRWGDHDQRLHLALTYEPFHGRSDSLRKPVVFELVPISIVNAATQVRTSALECAARPIAALLVCWRIIIDENPLSHEIRELFIACVAEKQRLVAITDENKRVMRDFELIHSKSPAIAHLTSSLSHQALDPAPRH
jgi:hypothetical protein